ncbi:conjugal transfer protein [Streptomyces sp. NRRL S-1868]|uniref:conjugal transfer protein n=1 Tax=Streptomyces sp. NRRL S-1868 TaxID=1463892 RepID=UPI0006899CAA|nr:conjugal transfer protein [Streptomyces sp. NRRL S-1868]
MRKRRDKHEPATGKPASRDEELFEEAEASGWAVMSTGSAALAVTAVRWLAWGLLVAGVVLGGLAWWTRPEQVTARPVRSAAEDEDRGVGPGGFAEMFVRAYLSGAGAEELSGYFPGAGDSGSGQSATTAAPRRQQGAEATAATRVRRAADGYWQVTVAARMPSSGADEHDGGDSGGDAPVLRYFQVPVRDTGGAGGLVAVSWPAEVAAPRTSGQAPQLAYGSAQEAVGSHPLVRTLQDVVGAYLVSGSLERYLAPGTSLAPVRPAPYTRATVRRVAEVGTNSPLAEPASAPRDGAKRRLLVDVEARTAPARKSEAASSWPLTYAVALTARDGRWEVSSLKAAPALDDSPTTHTKEK